MISKMSTLPTLEKFVRTPMVISALKLFLMLGLTNPYVEKMH